MPSYLSWSNKFVITYSVDKNGFETKKTRYATLFDRILPYQRPKPISSIHNKSKSLHS